MENVLTEQQRKDSWIWLFCGGTFAVCLALFVFWADRTLSTSDKEVRLGANLHEIRSAQASLPSSVDPRQIGEHTVSERLAELAKESK